CNHVQVPISGIIPVRMVVGYSGQGRLAGNGLAASSIEGRVAIRGKAEVERQAAGDQGVVPTHHVAPHVR
ncbi:MAG: hypothetical protein ACRDG4_19070, partial [Chloroflexota bacterium]